MTNPAFEPPAGDAAARLPFARTGILAIAHRGEWRIAPENSIAAIEAAMTAGADIVEIDARLAACGTPVVIHDDTLDRTSNGSGAVSAKTAQELAGVRLRVSAGGAGVALTGERLPLLAEALETARDRVAVNIDMKDPSEYPAVAALVVDMGMADQVIFKADVDPQAPEAGFAALPGCERFCFMPMMRAHTGRFATDIEAIAAFRPPMIELKFTDLAEIAAAHDTARRHGVRLWVNTLDVSHNLDFSDSRALVDPDDVWGCLIEAGVTAIQTDRTPELLGWLRAKNRMVQA